MFYSKYRRLKIGLFGYFLNVAIPKIFPKTYFNNQNTGGSKTIFGL